MNMCSYRLSCLVEPPSCPRRSPCRTPRQVTLFLGMLRRRWQHKLPGDHRHKVLETWHHKRLQKCFSGWGNTTSFQVGAVLELRGKGVTVASHDWPNGHYNDLVGLECFGCTILLSSTNIRVTSNCQLWRCWFYANDGLKLPPSLLHMPSSLSFTFDNSSYAVTSRNHKATVALFVHHTKDEVFAADKMTEVFAETP